MSDARRSSDALVTELNARGAAGRRNVGRSDGAALGGGWLEEVVGAIGPATSCSCLEAPPLHTVSTA